MMNVTFRVLIVITFCLTVINASRFSFRKYEYGQSPKQSVAKLSSCKELDRSSTVVCMFQFDCMRANGKPVGICMDRSFVKSCCKLPFIPSTEATTRKTSSETAATSEQTTKPNFVTTTKIMTTTAVPSKATEAVTLQPTVHSAVTTECANCINNTSIEVKTTQKVDETSEETTKPVTSKEPIVTTISTEKLNPMTTIRMEATEKSSFTSQPEEASTFIEVVTTQEQVQSTSSPVEAITTVKDQESNEKITTTIAEKQTTTQVPTTQPAVSDNVTIASRNTTASMNGGSTSSSTPEVPDVTTIFPSTANATNSTQRPVGIKSICGRRLMGPRGRIVGGSKSQFLEWPWMVSLRQWKKNSFLHKCGAALLNEYWVITAAHCVENVGPTSLLLRLGEYDVSHDREPYPHIDRRVLIIAPHPQFDPRTFEYDLALLRFSEPVNFRRNIIPVCIPDGNQSYVGESAVVAGWGRLYEDGPLPDTLQHVDVPIITNKACESMYRQAGYIEDIPNIFLCAGLAKGAKDSCEGDSGGPLVIEEDGQFNLIGIISWGIGCALPNQPGVYTRITEFSSWIHQIIGF